MILKNWQKDFWFLNNYISIGYEKMSPLRREWLSSTVNVLANSQTILHITKGDFFKRNFLHNDQ